MEVFMYSTGTSSELSHNHIFAICGAHLFSNVHHEDRNSHPFSLDKEGGLLSQFQESNYKDHLNHLFQSRASDSVGEPSTENKLDRLRAEINYWDHFSDACLYTTATAVFDIGMCGSAASPDDHSAYQYTMLDFICLEIESRRTKMMKVALNPGKEDPSLRELQDMFYGPGQPSPFLLWRSKQQCGSGVVAGSYAYVSRCKRLVIEDDRLAWLSDLHHSYDFRRIVLCNHFLEIIGVFHESEEKARLSEQFFKLHQLGNLPPLPNLVMTYMNRITRILRGVHCDRKISIHRERPQDSLQFTDARSKWKALLELINIRDLCSLETMDTPDKRPAANLVDALKCGIHVWEGYVFATWRNDDAEKIDVEILSTEIQAGSFEVCNFIHAAANLEAIELLLWVDMVLKFRKLSKADEHGGLFAIDVSELRFQQNPIGIFVNADVESMDLQVDRIIMAATGVADMACLEPLCLGSEYQSADKLAGHFDELSHKKSAIAEDKVIPGNSWLLDPHTERKINVMDRDNKRYVVELLPSNDLISYKHEHTRAVRRAFTKIFRGFSVMGFGGNVDLSSLFQAGAEDTSNTINALLRGQFDVVGVRYGLKLIFSGVVKVRRGYGTPTCYVPQVSHDDNGIVVNSFLPADIMSQATYFEREGRLFWLPGQGMNIFEVQTRVKSKTTHFEEIFEHSEIVEEDKHVVKRSNPLLASCLARITRFPIVGEIQTDISTYFARKVSNGLVPVLGNEGWCTILLLYSLFDNKVLLVGTSVHYRNFWPENVGNISIVAATLSTICKFAICVFGTWARRKLR